MTNASPSAWPASYFSLSNCEKVGVENLPALLRRAADELERRSIEPDQILDVTISQEYTGCPAWSMTIYWAQPDDAEVAQ